MSRPCEKRQAPGSRRDRPLDAAGAAAEAGRCLALRSCDSCDLCALLCPDLAITRDEETGDVVIDLDYCKGCGICAAVCPKGAIRMVLEK